MLVYELEHHPDSEARTDAAHALHRLFMGLSGSGGMVVFDSDAGATPPGVDLDLLALLLRAARADSSIQVRIAAIEGMASARLFSPEVTTALLDLTHDPYPGIRWSAAMALFGPPEPRVAKRLAELAEHDPDAGVRDMALDALATTAPEKATALQRPADGAPAESDGARLRRLAQRTIGTYGAPGGWELAKRYATDPASSRMLRETAMRTLGLAVFMSRATPEGSPEELVALLAPYLDSDDPSLRLVAAREMGEARIPAATAALEARKAVEVDARVLAQIDDSLRRIAAPDPMDDVR